MAYFEQINNRDTLLITIGDSWTEGVGCYDPELLPKFFDEKLDLQDMYLQSRHGGHFGRGGWPIQLAKMLNCDVINIAEGGDANSSSAKRLIQEYPELDSITKNYKKVTVLWLLTSPDRFGFYHRKSINNYLPDTSPTAISKAYYKDVNIDPLDSLLEASFYLRTVYWYCKAKNFNFIYGSAFTNIEPLNEVCDLPGNIHSHIINNCMTRYLDNKDESIWAHCWHPNNKGYFIIAQALYSILTSHFKDAI